MPKSKECFQVETPLSTFFPVTEDPTIIMFVNIAKKYFSKETQPSSSNGYLEASLRLHDVSNTRTKI